MSETKTSTTNLYVPANIKTRFEALPGFGFKEMAMTAMAGAMGVGVAVILHIVTAQESIMMGIFIAVVSLALGFVTTRKDDTNRSVLDSIKILIRFSKEQQKFKYVYIDPYRPIKN